MIFNESGGTSLNFKVVKNPQPGNPSPNTIWLNTDRKINGYSFSATQPENMEEGEVWFPVGVSSDVAFSATKKNSVMVYPLSAKQKIDGVLVDVTAKSYQGGKWRDWVKYLYLFKGGEGLLHEFSKGGGANSSVTVSNEKITISYSGSSGIHIVYETSEPKDLTDYKTLILEMSCSAVGVKGRVFVHTSFANQDTSVVAQTMLTANNTKTTYTIDVSSLSGNYYIGVSGDLRGEIYNWYLEG